MTEESIYDRIDKLVSGIDRYEKMETALEKIADHIERLKSELVIKSIDYDALNNSNRKLAEANARIVEFEDIKKGHLKVQEKYVVALEKILNEGNLAAQGHWDATDKMKTIAWEALK